MLLNEAATAMRDDIRDQGLTELGATRNAETLADIIALLPVPT